MDTQYDFGLRGFVDNINIDHDAKVIYINDSITSMEFVVQTLVNFFDYNSQMAMKITEDIHEAGSAVVAICPFEIAEQKGIEVTICARSENFPLQIKLEPETA
jgi:ATP-dependent Clp protease adaptor protein ClpS